MDSTPGAIFPHATSRSSTSECAALRASLIFGNVLRSSTTSDIPTDYSSSGTVGNSEPSSRLALCGGCLGIGFQLRGQLPDPLLHHLAHLEFDGGARRDVEVAARLVWVSADPWFGQLNLKHAEIAQFDIVPF